MALFGDIGPECWNINEGFGRKHDRYRVSRVYSIH